MTKILFLLPIISEILKNHSQFTGIISESKKLIKDELHAEILSLSIKFLCGLILASVIIFSLISIGQQINILLLPLEHGHLSSMALFAFLTILSVGALASIFRTQKLLKPDQGLPDFNDSTNDLSKVMTSFLNGFAEGLAKQPVNVENNTALSTESEKKS